MLLTTENNEAQKALREMREATAAIRKLFPAFFVGALKDKGAIEAGEATRRALASVDCSSLSAASNTHNKP